MRSKAGAIAHRARQTEPHTYAWLVTLCAVVGIVLLAALGKPVPASLDLLSGAGVGAGAGLARRE